MQRFGRVRLFMRDAGKLIIVFRFQQFVEFYNRRYFRQPASAALFHRCQCYFVHPFLFVTAGDRSFGQKRNDTANAELCRFFYKKIESPRIFQRRDRKRNGNFHFIVFLMYCFDAAQSRCRTDLLYDSLEHAAFAVGYKNLFPFFFAQNARKMFRLVAAKCDFAGADIIRLCVEVFHDFVADVVNVGCC